MSGKRTPSSRYAGWPRFLRDPDSDASHYARRVVVRWRFQSILTGTPTVMLQSEPLKSMWFHSVHAVDIEMSLTGKISPAQMEGAEDRAAEFCESLLALFPSATSFVITLSGMPGADSGRTSSLATFMLSKLRGCATRVRLQMPDPLELPALAANPTTNLTSLCAHVHGNQESVAQLLALNSERLLDLDLTFSDIGVLRAMVYNGDTGISYPRLYKLVLTAKHRGRSLEEPLVTAGCPFPALRHLHLDTDYPFSDDTLFRGNHATLEYLHMFPDRRPLSILRGYLASVDATMGSLRRLVMVYPPQERPDDAMDVPTAKALVSRLVPSVRSLALHVRGERLDTADGLAWAGLFPSQVSTLKVTCRDLDIDEFIMLLKGMPQLKTLECDQGGEGNLEDMGKEWLDGLYTAHYPLNSSFWCWKLYRVKWATYDQVVALTMVLAILCPNFAGFTYDNRRMIAYSDYTIEELCQSDMFSSYASRISRILYPEQYWAPSFEKAPDMDYSNPCLD
ncbi:hypothetical protein H4R19_001945 [Coemansia spiralis]|nr:hypothetical protein H4R19_001945 [Coemansia spiralis]